MHCGIVYRPDGGLCVCVCVCVFRCMVEAGFEYNTDVHIEPATLEQMLNKSPIKHVSKVSADIIYCCLFLIMGCY